MKEIFNADIYNNIVRIPLYQKYIDIFEKEYVECVWDILISPKFMEMDKYIQHGHTTTLEHCIYVSYLSFKIARAYRLDYESTARGAILHDMFLYDWHTHYKETGKSFHGLTHPRVAFKNANHYFNLNKKEKDIILKHMWPITITPPRYLESYVVMYADKYCGFIETSKKVMKNIRYKISF